MNSDSQEYWDWQYRRLIPKQFWIRSGVERHSFRILDPHAHSYVQLRETDGSVKDIEQSAYCAIMFNGRFRRLLVSATQDERLFEAIVFLGQTFRSGTKVTRYLNLYKSYESITKVRQPEFSAVRHALGHSSAALNRPTTVKVLNKLFGGTYINLDMYRHTAELYRQFGGMLIENDALISGAIMRQFPAWTRIRSTGQLWIRDSTEVV